MTNLPELRRGMKQRDAILLLRDWCRGNRPIFSERFRVNQGVGGMTVDLASGAGSSTILATAVSTGTITAASSKSTYPVTFGGGPAKLDIDGTTTAGQSAATITLVNRFPDTYAADDLFVVRSNDGGATWHIVNRYCP